MCSIQIGQDTKEVETLSIQDCLIIWEYFACRGNSTAAALLRACAEQNIFNLIERMTSPYTQQQDCKAIA